MTSSRTSRRQPDSRDLLRPFRDRFGEVRVGNDGSFEEWNDALYLAGLTDGLPVVPPTPERIAATLAAWEDYSPDAEPLPPSFMAPTAWDLAVHTVMAGCEPRYVPVIVAALRALAEPQFNLLGIQATTGSATPVLIVGGPVVSSLGINAGANCMGPGRRANATIGRAVRLVLQNVALAIPGVSDMATQGQPGKYTWCLAEAEADSPWPPLRAGQGFDLADSTVTVVGAAGNLEVVLGGETPEENVAVLATSMRAGNIGVGGEFGGGQALILLPPESAVFFASRGWSREHLLEAIFAEGLMPQALLPMGIQQRLQRRRIEAGEPGSDWIPLTRSPQDIHVVVTGGVGVKSTFIPTWGGGTKAVTRLVEPIATRSGPDR